MGTGPLSPVIVWILKTIQKRIAKIGYANYWRWKERCWVVVGMKTTFIELRVCFGRQQTLEINWFSVSFLWCFKYNYSYFGNWPYEKTGVNPITIFYYRGIYETKFIATLFLQPDAAFVGVSSMADETWLSQEVRWSIMVYNTLGPNCHSRCRLEAQLSRASDEQGYETIWPWALRLRPPFSNTDTNWLSERDHRTQLGGEDLIQETKRQSVSATSDNYRQRLPNWNKLINLHLNY